jgi:hypothetical protein
LNSDGGSSGGGEDTSAREATFNHGLIMWISWFIFGLVQIASNRWFMHLSQYMPALHTLSGLLILASSFYCVFLLIINFGALYLDHLHNLVGFIILCLVTLISLGGMATAFVKRSVKWNTKFIVRFKVAHRVFGFLTWLFAIFVTCTGLESYSEL